MALRTQIAVALFLIVLIVACAGCNAPGTAGAARSPQGDIDRVEHDAAPRGDDVPAQLSSEAEAPRGDDVSARSSAKAEPTAVPPIGEDMDDVEEVVVVGKRIRRWLPFVGADWPTKNCQLRTRTVGHGDLRVVFIADLGRSGRAWRHVARSLSVAAGRAALVTLPGSAGNRPCTWRGAVLPQAIDLVESFIGDSDAGSLALIGDGVFGGRVALEVASRAGRGKIHNLVLFDFVPYQWPLMPLAVKAYRRTNVPSVFAGQARLVPPGYFSGTSNLAAWMSRDFASKDVRREVTQTFSRSDPVTVSYEFFRSIGPKEDMRSLMAGMTSPTLTIWPAGAPNKPRHKIMHEVAAQYAQLDGVRWHALPGYGLAAMLEAPEEVANAVLSFWADVGFARGERPSE